MGGGDFFTRAWTFSWWPCLCVGLQNVVFASCFDTRMLYAFVFSALHATFSAHLTFICFCKECKSQNHEACHYAVLSGLMLVSVSSRYSAQHSVLKQPLSGFCNDHLITCLSLNDTWEVCMIINNLSVWFVLDMFLLHTFMMKGTISFTSPWSFEFYKGSAYGSQAWQLNSIC